MNSIQPMNLQITLDKVMSKLHEHFILSSISPFLATTDKQLVLRLDMALTMTSVHFCKSKLLHNL